MAITVPPQFYDQSTNYPLPRVGQQTIGTVAGLIAAYNPKRLGAVITNTSTSTVFLGPDKGVTTGSGHALLAGNSLTLMSPCEVWGIASGPGNLVTTFEEQVR